MKTETETISVEFTLNQNGRFEVVLNETQLKNFENLDDDEKREFLFQEMPLPCELQTFVDDVDAELGDYY